MVMSPEPGGLPDPADAEAWHPPAPPAGMVGSLGPLFRIVKDERVAFLIVGGLNTALGTGFFLLYQFLIGDSLGNYGYMVALVGAHISAVPCAFVLYRRFVFRVRGHVWLDLWRFELVNLTSFGINLLVLPFAVEVLGLDPIPAQLLITAGSVTISYFGHKLFSFRRRKEKSG